MLIARCARFVRLFCLAVFFRLRSIKALGRGFPFFVS
jgi:hypothetical protein